MHPGRRNILSGRTAPDNSIAVLIYSLWVQYASTCKKNLQISCAKSARRSTAKITIANSSPLRSPRVLVLRSRGWDHVPEPNDQNAVVNRHNAERNRKGAERFAEAHILLEPPARAGCDHQNTKQCSYGRKKADRVGKRVMAAELKDLSGSSAEEAGCKAHEQPDGGSQNANHVSPAILHVEEHDEDREVDDGLVEMEQEKIGLQMTKEKKANHLEGAQGRNVSIIPHDTPWVVRTLKEGRPARVSIG